MKNHPRIIESYVGVGLATNSLQVLRTTLRKPLNLFESSPLFILFFFIKVLKASSGVHYIIIILYSYWCGYNQLKCNDFWIQDFLQVMNKVFIYSSLFGIMGSRKLIVRIWSSLVLAGLLVVVALSIWKLIKALSGCARDITDQSK